MKNNEINPIETKSTQIRRTTDVPLRTKTTPIPTLEEAKEIMTGVTQKNGTNEKSRKKSRQNFKTHTLSIYSQSHQLSIHQV